MVITRFAPSPTGDLHVGSARTALFGWLWSKNQKGKFILRIEDTDRERSTQEAVQVILDSMQWLGLDWDEGPIYQTQRFPRYKEVASQLEKQNHVYRCYCSKERLEKLREDQIAAKQKARYDGHCRDIKTPPTPDAPYVLRFRTPQTGSIVFNDLVRGPIETQNSELDDLIIVRTDGTPTYNFTVVVDDADMAITHVLRGDDHINNTPRQIHILQALNAKIPEYGHMPMLLAPDGKKLSKRTGAASVLEYRHEGILPKALLNYLVRLGWSHGDQEIFTPKEMIDLFDVNNINVSPSALNPQKLLWLNQHYLKTDPPEEIAEQLRPFMENQGVDLKEGPDLKEVVIALRERSKTLVEMVNDSVFLFQKTIVLDAQELKEHDKGEGLNHLQIILSLLNNIDEWNFHHLHLVFSEELAKHDIKLRSIGQLLRYSITGIKTSLPIDVILTLLGKEKSIERMSQAINLLKN